MDYFKILQYTKQYQIVGLGEATYGQMMVTQQRILIFKHLINYRFHNLVLEANYGICKHINEYIKGFEDNLDKYFNELSFNYRNNQYHDLFVWMREYNQKHDNILSIYGLDLEDASDSYSSEVLDIIKINLNIFWNSRDRKMFEVFKHIYNPYSKYLIFAHNKHLMKNTRFFGSYSLGDWINRYYGGYSAIGNGFNFGEYFAYEQGNRDGYFRPRLINVVDNNYNPDGFSILNNNSALSIGMGGAIGNMNTPNMFYKPMNLNNTKFDAMMINDIESPIFPMNTIFNKEMKLF